MCSLAIVPVTICVVCTGVYLHFSMLKLIALDR